MICVLSLPMSPSADIPISTVRASVTYSIMPASRGIRKSRNHYKSLPLPSLPRSLQSAPSIPNTSLNVHYQIEKSQCLHPGNTLLDTNNEGDLVACPVDHAQQPVPQPPDQLAAQPIFPENEIDDDGNGIPFPDIDIADGPPPDDGGEEEEVAIAVEPLIPNWLVLWSIYLSTGAHAVSETQSVLIRRLLSIAFHTHPLHWRENETEFINLQLPQVGRDHGSLPSYTTIWRTVRPRVLRHLTLPLAAIQCPSYRSGGVAYSSIHTIDPPTNTMVDVVLSSQHAIQDISTPIIWDLFQSIDVDDEPSIIHDRHIQYDVRRSFVADESLLGNVQPFRVLVGDIVDIHCREAVSPLSQIGIYHRHAQENGLNVIRARVQSIYGIQNYRRFDEPHGEDDIADSNIPPFLQFVDYDVTSDDDIMPGKLLLKPGDICVSLSFITEAGANLALFSSTVLLVYRFWVDGNEDRRHILHLAQDVEAPPGQRTTTDNMSEYFSLLTDDGNTRHIAVARVVLHNNDASRFANEGTQRIPSTGQLANGENYFIYRFNIYTDGFMPSAHDAISLHGVYISVLNFGVHAHISTDSTRIVSLTSDDVTPYSIHEAIRADVEVGTTTGFPAFDANGNPCRIFLDVVGITGDTPALNYALDIRGLRNICPCHRCIQRAEGFPLPFAVIPPAGAETSYTRHSFRHQAINDSNAPEVILREFGIKGIVPTSAYPFQRYSRMLLTSRPNVPTNTNGVPILPSIFEPYAASFICPDHLLTGLAKSAIAIAVRSLREGQRQIFSDEMQHVFSINRLTPNAPIVTDVVNSHIRNMTCTDLYNCIVFMPFVYVRAVSLGIPQGLPFPTRYVAVFTLVYNLSILTAAIWMRPRNDNYIADVQRLTIKYMTDIQEMAPTLTAVFQGLLNRPNLHRLYEFAFRTLPYIDHASFTAELNLEKRHKHLKRSITRSNGKVVHRFAMRNIVVEDWKSRLGHLRMPLTVDNPDDARSARRLICGAQTAQIQQDPSPVLVERLNAILAGPGLAPSQELPSPGHTCPRSNTHRSRDILASAYYQARTFRMNTDFYNGLRPEIRAHFQNNAVQDPQQAGDNLGEEALLSFLRLPYAPTWSSPDSPPPQRIHTASIIEMRCYSSSNYEIQAPFVFQTQRSLALDVPQEDEGIMLWYVQDILTTSRLGTSDDIVLLLYPILHQNDDAFPVIPPPNYINAIPPESHFPTARITRGNLPVAARLNNTVIRVGNYPVTFLPHEEEAENDDDAPPPPPILESFIAIRKSHGFPPHHS